MIGKFLSVILLTVPLVFHIQSPSYAKDGNKLDSQCQPTTSSYSYEVEKRIRFIDNQSRPRMLLLARYGDGAMILCLHRENSTIYELIDAPTLQNQFIKNVEKANGSQYIFTVGINSGNGPGSEFALYSLDLSRPSKPNVGMVKTEDDWTNCSYNQKDIKCKRVFIACKEPPCELFEIIWIDGAKDRYEMIDSASRTSGIYKDLRGGVWTLTAYLGAFVLRNNENANTIIYGANYNECINEMKFGDLCGYDKIDLPCDLFGMDCPG